MSTHRQFLRTALLDDALIEFLDSQLALETQPPHTGEVADNAIRCLFFLFNATGVFAPATEDAYDIEVSFDPDAPVTGSPFGFGPGTGFYDAVANDLTDLYLLMASVRFMYRRDGTALAAGDLDSVKFLRPPPDMWSCSTRASPAGRASTRTSRGSCTTQATGRRCSGGSPRSSS